MVRSLLVGVVGAGLAMSQAAAQQPAANSPFDSGRASYGTWPEVGTSKKNAAAVSVDTLRHPLPSKAKRMLQAALEMMRRGHHQESIAQLRETLTRYPSSAAYVQSLLGVEYLKTDRFSDAVDSFREAVTLLPHDAVNHYNLAVSFVSTGDLDHGEQEVRKARELDPGNPRFEPLYQALVQRKTGN
jgi:Flp pilus assembly protein TadD